MAKCACCGTSILFGGKKDGDLRFCNDKCWQKGVVVRLAEQIPDHLVQEHVASVHAGSCPKCQGAGPVDLHTSYRVWSILVLTRSSSRATVCCHSCGRKQRLYDSALCLTMGWWGFPWGLIFTPVQLFRNIAGIISPPDPSAPSEALTSVLRSQLAADFLAKQKAEEQAAAE